MKILDLSSSLNYRKPLQIRNNTKLQIEALKVKYAIPDAIKTTSGFIAIGTLGSLQTIFF